MDRDEAQKMKRMEMTLQVIRAWALLRRDTTMKEIADKAAEGLGIFDLRGSHGLDKH